jgi:DNA-binding response OmpR family regulator
MKTILIIDDEPDLCALLKAALIGENYIVECAFSLSEAERKLNSHFKVVLLDNNLPDGTGLEYIQTHPVQFQESFVIMISADSNPVLEMKAKQEGVDAFIHKPFSVRSVKELIKRVA